MGKMMLERFLVAAEDDPVLASWAKVAHDYKVGSHVDVPPDEHWEAYQELFMEGLVSPELFDSVDVKKTFFSGKIPPQGDVYGVLSRIRLLCPDHYQEEPMNKDKPMMSAFSQNSIATRRDTGNSMARATPRRAPSRPPGGLTAFKGQSAIAQGEARPAGLQPFRQPEQPVRTALECSSPVDAGMYVGGMELNGHMVCHGKPLQSVEEGGDIISPDEMLGNEDYAIVEYMFHAECQTCDAIYHVTGSKRIPRDSY